MTLTALWHSPVQHFSAGLFVPLEQLWQMCVIITWATPAQDSSQIIACPQRKHTHLTLALWTCHSTWKVPLWSIMLYAKRFKFSCTQWTVTLSNLDVVKCLSQTGKTFLSHQTVYTAIFACWTIGHIHNMTSTELPYTVKLTEQSEHGNHGYHLSTLNKIQVLLDVMPRQLLNF